MLPLKREEGVQLNSESLIRVLLLVPLLTDKVASMLLEKLSNATGKSKHVVPAIFLPPKKICQYLIG